MALSKDAFTLEDEELIESSSKSTTTAEIASWRIGDKWTYETQFDVAQLIAQANVEVPKTGYDIEKFYVQPVNKDGTPAISTSKTADTTEARASSSTVKKAKTSFVFATLQSSILNSHLMLHSDHSI